MDASGPTQEDGVLLEDLSDLNADWNFAEQHGRSMRPGFPISKDGRDNPNSRICGCCLNQITKTQIPLCDNTKQLEFVGFGFPVYFSLIRCCLLLLFTLMTSYSALALYHSIKYNLPHCLTSYVSSDSSHHRLLESNSGSSSNQINCFSFMIVMAQFHQGLTEQEIIFRIITWITTLFTLLYIREKLNKLVQYFDQKTTSLSDFSIIVKNLPTEKGIQKKVRNFFMQAFKDQHQIQQLTLIPFMEQFQRMKHQKEQLTDKKKKLMKVKVRDEKSLQKIEGAIARANLNFKRYCRRSRDQAQADEMVTEQMIVVLDTQHEKNQVLLEFDNIDRTEMARFFGNRADSIALEEALEPKQIVWENINYPRSKKIARIILGWLMAAAFIVSVTVLFYFILRQKTKLVEEAVLGSHEDPAHWEYTKKGAFALVYIMLILIILFNKFILSFVCHKITVFECHENTSSEQFSFALKYGLGLFFTTALMTLMVQAFTFRNYYSHEYGVIQEETIMFFLNAFFVPLIWLVNPWHLFRIIKRRIYHGSEHMTQEQANHLMEPISYDMGKRLAQILQTMWFTYLYATIVPVGAFVSFFGLLCYYWTDKYNLLRRCSVPRHVSGKLMKRTLLMLDFILILFPLGSILFDYQLANTYHWSTIAMICLSGLYLLLPWDKILHCFISEEFMLEKKTFSEVKYQFLQNYHTMQPIRRALHLEAFLNKRASQTIRKGTVLRSYSNISITSPLKVRNNNEQNTAMIEANLDGTRGLIDPNLDSSEEIVIKQTKLVDE